MTEETLRTLDRLRLAPLDAVLEGLAGEHVGRRKTSAVEFDDFRSYAPGDDFRQIDWNAYARLGELFVKTSLEQANVTMSLLLDRSGSMWYGKPSKIRYGERLAAALGALALARFDSVRIFALGGRNASGGVLFQGRTGLSRMLRELGGISLVSDVSLAGALADYNRQAQAGGIAVLISDMLTPPAEDEAAVAGLAARSLRALLIQVNDTAELVPDVGGTVELEDVETQRRMVLTVTASVREQYLDRVRARTERLAALCRRYHVIYARVDTAIPPARLLTDRFRREGFLQV